MQDLEISSKQWASCFVNEMPDLMDFQKYMLEAMMVPEKTFMMARRSGKTASVMAMQKAMEEMLATSATRSMFIPNDSPPSEVSATVSDGTMDYFDLLRTQVKFDEDYFRQQYMSFPVVESPAIRPNVIAFDEYAAFENEQEPRWISHEFTQPRRVRSFRMHREPRTRANGVTR